MKILKKKSLAKIRERKMRCCSQAEVFRCFLSRTKLDLTAGKRRREEEANGVLRPGSKEGSNWIPEDALGLRAKMTLPGSELSTKVTQGEPSFLPSPLPPFPSLLSPLLILLPSSPSSSPSSPCIRNRLADFGCLSHLAYGTSYGSWS